MQGQESNVVAQNIGYSAFESEIECLWDYLFGGFESLPNEFVAACALSEVLLLNLIHQHIRVEQDFNVCNFIIVDVILVDLFGNDEQPHEIFLLDHDFHLIEDKFKLFSLIHGSICLDLDFLQNLGCLKDIIVALLAFHNEQNASSILNL